MATGQAHVVLRHLRKLVAPPGLDALTDGQLLERFVAAQDEAAFAALVRRHGPLVLGACRRLLHGRADAEDAFQATFIVLFRRARSLDRRGSLAGWLYTVAYHVALRARAAAARRRLRERRVVEMPRTECHAEAVWRDLQPVLDDELNRLPEKYRAPVLLCYVQGKTNEEAGRLLRVPVGTVKTRLARARETLRRRLTRRGITLTGAALAAVLAGRAAAAVPAGLVAVTLETTLRLASGEAAAASVPAVALAEGVLKAMFATKLKIATVVLVAAGALALGAGLLSRPALAQRASTPPAPAAPPAATEPAKGTGRPGAVSPAAAKKEMVVTGRVLDPDGKPVPHAAMAVVARQGMRLSTWEKEVFDHIQVAGKTEADGDGRFRLAVPRLPAASTRLVRVVALAPGYGMGWVALDPDADRPEAEVRLLPEARLAGRVLDLQGAGVPGLVVHVNRLTRKGANARPEDNVALPDEGVLGGTGAATTDAQGRFAFRGIGREVTVRLEINDPRCALKELWLNTGDRKKAENLLLTLAPGQVAEGRVVYVDTGKPVPNARLEIGSYNEGPEGLWQGGGTVDGQADEQGRYHINIYPGNKYYVRAYAPAGQPYLATVKGQSWPKGAVRQEMEVALPRGIAVHGKVTEAPSGKPVAGAYVEYDCPREQAEKHQAILGWASRVATGPDGSYTIAVPPGSGRLVVTAPTPDYIAEPVGSGELELGKPGGDPFYYHATAPLTTKAGEQPKDVNLTLRPGVTIRGRLVGPDDKPVNDAVMFCSHYRPPYEKALSPITVHGGRWELRGCDPERTYRLTVISCAQQLRWMMTAAPGSMGRLMLPELLGPQNKLGAVAEVSARKAGGEPITVRLQPTVAATIRFHNAQGQPPPDYTPYLELVVTPGPSYAQAVEKGTLAAEEIVLGNPFQRSDNSRTPPGQPGVLKVEGLIPGATYRVRVFQGEPLKDFQAEPGKTAEVDVTVK